MGKRCIICGDPDPDVDDGRCMDCISAGVAQREQTYPQRERRSPSADTGGREAHRWNIDQIMTFVWQMIAEDQSQEEYPFSVFDNSSGGKRLRTELQALARSADPGTTGAEVLREALIAIQLEHETKYHEEAGRWHWSCACGLTECVVAWDDCHKLTRGHWADVVVAATQRAPVTPESRLSEVIDACHEEWIKDGTVKEKPAPVTTPGRDAPELRFLEDVLENFQTGGDGIWAAQKLLVLRIEQLRGEALAAAKEPRG